MFNLSVRREAIEKFEEAVNRYKSIRKEVKCASVRLFDQRQRVASEVIERVEEYVNRLAHSPKEFDKSVIQYRIEVSRFDRTDTIELKAVESNGIESNLSPIWLGSRAISSDGNAAPLTKSFMTVAGSLVLISLLVVAVGYNEDNKRLAEDATQKRFQLEAEIRSLEIANRKIKGLEVSIKEQVEGCLAEIDWLIDYESKNRRQLNRLQLMIARLFRVIDYNSKDKQQFNRLQLMVVRLFKITGHDMVDYRYFSEEQKNRLAVLINHTRALGQLLKAEVTI